MLEAIKEWWDRFRNGEDYVPEEEDDDEDVFDAYDMSIELLRKLLASVNLQSIPKSKDEMQVSERKAYVQQVAAFFPDIIENRVKRLIRAQEELTSRGSNELREMMPDPRDQVIFARGTINGLMLVFEDFEEDFQEYIGSLPKDEIFDKHKLFPELFPNEERSVTEE